MKKSLIGIISLCSLMIFSYDVLPCSSYGEELASVLPSIQSSEEISPEEALTLLIGEWTIAPINDLKPGELIVKDEKQYSLTRWDSDNIGSTITGEYKFDTSQEIYTIDFCLEKCGQPGSEWTTQVGILRFITKDEIEIQFSPDGVRPLEFTPKENDFYFLKLTRKKIES
jgi:hypothetical protein